MGKKTTIPKTKVQTTINTNFAAIIRCTINCTREIPWLRCFNNGLALRGLDIPNIDYVINFDLPSKSKDYIHRVGRTARAGKAGTAITFVTQYEIETFQRLEQVLGLKLDVYPVEEQAAMALKNAVSEAERESRLEMKRILSEQNKKKKKGKDADDDDTEESLGIRKKIKKKKFDQ